MARPDLSRSTEQLYESLGVMSAGDEATGWQLLRFAEALADALLEQIASLTSESEPDEDGHIEPGWAILFHPDRVPADALAFVGQFVGARLLPAMSEAERRAEIKLPAGRARGRLPALIAAAKRTLTGSQTVLVDERFGGSAYALRVRTLASETPDEDRTLAAIRSQKPGGIALTYAAIAGQDWNDVATKHADWAAVDAAYDDWRDVATTAP